MEKRIEPRVEEGVSEPKEIEVPDKSVHKEFIGDLDEITDEMPLAIFENKKRQPFLVEHFNAGEIYEHNGDDFQKKIVLIDKWIKDKINVKEMSLSIGSYKNVLDELINETKVNSDSDFVKINKLYDFLKFLYE